MNDVKNLLYFPDFWLGASGLQEVRSPLLKVFGKRLKDHLSEDLWRRILHCKNMLK